MLAFYKLWKKYNEIQLTKNKMDLKTIEKLKIIHPPQNNFTILEEIRARSDDIINASRNIELNTLKFV